MRSPKRIVLVTGGASGIGAATCRALAAPGTAILIHTRRNRIGADRVATAVREAGGDAAVALGDLSAAEAAETAVAEAVATFGGLDVVVSNAGFADRTPASDLTDAAFDQSLAAIAGALLRLVRAALPHLRQANNPRVVAVSSFVAHAFRTDLPVFPASAAAKAAQEALVRALAIELAPSRITVNAVVPGFTRKDAGAHAALAATRSAELVDRIPLGRLGLPEDVAAAIAYLASPSAGYVTGQALHVSGGLVI